VAVRQERVLLDRRERRPGLFEGRRFAQGEATLYGATPAPAPGSRDMRRGRPYVIWYGSDSSGGTKGLRNADGSLRPNGEAFRAYAAAHAARTARA
jgi:hypothetical protein